MKQAILTTGAALCALGLALAPGCKKEPAGPTGGPSSGGGGGGPSTGGPSNTGGGGGGSQKGGGSSAPAAYRFDGSLGAGYEKTTGPVPKRVDLNTPEMKDALLVGKVGAAIGVVKLLAVTVDVKAGIVTLTGSVKTEDEKAAIEKAAKGVADVKGVVNQLKVGP